MRIVGGRDGQWFVWDCELCLEPKNILWLEDEPPRYWQADHPMHCVPGTDEVAGRLKGARRIVIYPARRTILINPHEDVTDIDGTGAVLACGEAA